LLNADLEEADPKRIMSIDVAMKDILQAENVFPTSNIKSAT